MIGTPKLRFDVALLVHRIGKVPLDDCIGRGTGLDDAGLARKRLVLAAAAVNFLNGMASFSEAGVAQRSDE